MPILEVPIDQLDSWLRDDGPAEAEDTLASPGDVRAAAVVTAAPAGTGAPAAADVQDSSADLHASVVAYLQNDAGYDADEEYMRRRSFLISAAVIAGLGAADTSAAVEAVRRELNLALVEERAAADADEWQEIIRDYGETYPVAAPADLLQSLIVDILGVRAALHQHGSTEPQRDLLRAAALLAAFTAQTFSNMGKPLEAQRWWRTAKNTADRSGDPYSALWVRSREIQRTLDSRPVPALLRLIAEAEGLTGQAPPAATLALIQAKAQTFALAGRKHDALEALNLLRTQFSQSPVAYSGSVLTWDEDNLHGTEGFCYARLGDFRKAEIATADGLSLYAANGNTSKRWEADLQLYLALALVRTGDISEGLRHARRVISTMPEMYRSNALAAGRILLNTVPLGDQQSTVVKAYREWIGSLSLSAIG